MASGLLQGAQAPIRLNTGTYVLHIISSAPSTGITVVGNRFTLADLGPYFQQISLMASGAGDSVSFRFQLFNVTLAVEAAGQDLVAPAARSPGLPYTFQLPFTVTNIAHEYEFRLVVRNTNPPNILTTSILPVFQSHIEGTSGSGTIQEITGSGSIVVTNPFGPVTDIGGAPVAAIIPFNEYWVDKNGSDLNLGTNILPFKTVGKAVSVIGNAINAAEFNDPALRSYTVHIGTGTYLENLTMPVRPNVTFDFAVNAVIEGNLVSTWDAALITTLQRAPKQIFISKDQRGGIDIFGCLTGIKGNMTINADGAGQFYALQFHLIGMVGNIIWQRRAGGAGAPAGQNFFHGAILKGIVSSTNDLITCTVWAFGVPRNHYVGDPDGIGGISGKVSFGYLSNITITGDVSGNGNRAGWLTNVQWEPGHVVDLSSYNAQILFDPASWYQLQTAYPAHGLPLANTGFIGFNTPFKVNSVNGANYIVQDFDYNSDIDFTTGGADRTCTLPLLATVTNLGRIIRVTKVDAGAGRVVVTCGGGNTFQNGATTIALKSVGATVLLIGLTTGWKVVSMMQGGPVVENLQFMLGDGSGVVAGGVHGDYEVPYACVIQKVDLLADQIGNLVVDIWKDSYANFPPTIADTITAAAKPTLAGTIKSTDSTLTGWIKDIAAGDILRFNVDSSLTLTRVLLSLTVVRV